MAIIDSGVDVSHEDLPRKLGRCVGKRFISQDWTKTDTDLGRWHILNVWTLLHVSHTATTATEIFGIIAAISNNDVGIVSMASNPNTCYIIARVMDISQ